MKLRTFIKTSVREYLNEQTNSKNEVKLYHSITNNNWNIIKNVISRGLLTHDNKQNEEGKIIWFSNNYNNYCKKGDFCLAYTLDLSKNGQTSNEAGLVYDGKNGYAHNDIPFNKLEIIKIPIGEAPSGDIVNNKDFLPESGVFQLTPEHMKGFKIYADLFNEFVLPYIDNKNFISEIEPNNEVINLF